MNTGTIARSAALLLAWAGISGLASAQALGRTSEEKRTITAVEQIEAEANGAESDGAESREAAEAIEKMGDWLGTFDEIRTGLEKSDGFIRSNDELVLAFLFSPMEGESQLLRQYMKSVVTGMDAVPDTFYAQLDAKVASLWTEINRLAPSVAPVGGAEADGIVKLAIEKRVAQGAPEAKVVRSVLSGDRWAVKMTDGGLPKSEYRRGHVMYRLPNQELVICQQVIVERPYFGSAKSASDYSVRLGYLRLQEKP